LTGAASATGACATFAGAAFSTTAFFAGAAFFAATFSGATFFAGAAFFAVNLRTSGALGASGADTGETLRTTGPSTADACGATTGASFAVLAADPRGRDGTRFTLAGTSLRAAGFGAGREPPGRTLDAAVTTAAAPEDTSAAGDCTPTCCRSPSRSLPS
jgi:hypothetical protein